MKLILYKANETTFETYGLGEIDATKALVTRERNGNYTLYIEYPASGRLASVFKNDMRIKSDAGLRTKNQTFYISRILKSSKGIIKIYAKHISHLTEFMAMRNGTLANGTASSALSIWASNTLGGVRFDTWSDITTSNRTSWDIANFKNAREALGGREGSILDVWGGEFEFDNTTIRLHKQLGRKSPIVLEYGRNILSAEDEQDIGATYTSIYPYATYTPDSTGSTDGHSEAITVELPEKYIDSKYVGLYNERRVEIVDFSSSFKEKEVPTAAKLRNLANAYIINNNVGLPKINTKIEYVDLSKAQDHASNQILEEAELCDIVPIYYPPIGITSEDGKLTTIVFDVLRGVNDSVEVGTIGEGIRSAMTSGLATQVSDIAKSQKQLVDTLPKYLLNAQGNKVWYNRPDANIEHKVGDIWFEKNGLYDRMYVWNGTMWEKRIDTEDVDKVKKEVDKLISDAQNSTKQAIAQANAKAEEALKKAGTIPDTARLSEQVKRQVLESQDLTKKVTETLKETDSGVIYNKILQNVKTEFVTKQSFDGFERSTNDDLSRLNTKTEETERKIIRQNIEFNKLTETNKLYERIIGTSETDAPDKVSRLVMSSEIFQTEVGKYVTDDNNLIVNSMTMDKHTLVGNSNPKANVSVDNGIFTIKAEGLTGYNWSGFTLPIYVKKIYQDETYTLGFKYRILSKPDSTFAFNIKNHGLNKTLLSADIGTPNSQASEEWYEFQRTFTVGEDFAFGEDANYPFYIYLAKNGWIEFKEPILVRGSRTGTYKPSQFDDAYKKTNEAKKLAENAQTQAENAQIRAQNAQTRAIQVAEEAEKAKITAEATRTQVTQLAGSYSIRNLNSAGDILGQMNLNPDGSVRINEGLLSIGEKTYIKDGVIKKSMIGKAQIGTAHIDEIDASKANLINVTAKNIATDGLTANIIKGGILQSLTGTTNFDLNQGLFQSMGGKTGLVLHGGALDFVEKNGRSVAGYSIFVNKYGRVAGGAIGSHEGYDFFISTKGGAKPMIVLTDSNQIKMTAKKMMLYNNMTIVSNQASEYEDQGIQLKRYNKGGGWCTAIINSRDTSGIEFYDDGKIRLINRGTFWEPGR